MQRRTGEGADVTRSQVPWVITDSIMDSVEYVGIIKSYKDVSYPIVRTLERTNEEDRPGTLSWFLFKKEKMASQSATAGTIDIPPLLL